MFAKRRANVRNLAGRQSDFVLSINFVRRAREVLFNPALRKHFSVAHNFKMNSNGTNEF
jgi:hypothetical protein